MRISYRNRPELKKYSGFKKLVISRTVVKVIDQSRNYLAKQIKKDSTDTYYGRGVFIFPGGSTWFYDFNEQSLCYNVYYKGELIYFFDSTEHKTNDKIFENLNFILVTLAFIKYAKIENKFLKPNKKEKLFGCKYKNETDSDIEIIDSRWFTNLVKSDAFKVRGHFRLQPKKKDGKWTKELIWINEFEKKGYTAKARKTKMTE